MIGPFVQDLPATRVVFGIGLLDQLSDEVKRIDGRRVMLIYGNHESAYAEQVESQLGYAIVARFTDVVMHVPASIAQTATELCRAADVDLLVALGGGSSTGLAKAIAKATGLPIIAIPTTYSGSEMTTLWGLTENSRKVTGRDARVLPRTVIYDPLLTLSLPQDLSAASGMNAIAHLVEGLYAPGISPVAMLQCEEGVRALAKALPRIAADPHDVDARTDALYGAWLAGWALGTTGIGVHHKICHVIGGAYDLPHAATHSAVLPYATAFNEPFAPGAMDAVVRALRSAGIDADSAGGGIWDLATSIGAPTSLRDAGFDPKNTQEAAELVVAANPVNPRPIELAGILELFISAYDGTRPVASTK